MIRIDHDLLRRTRLELGWTPEELAEKSDLDARTVRRIEQGGSRTRLHSALALARALNLELTALVLDDRPTGVVSISGNGSRATTGRRLRTELVSPGEWSLKEALYVLSLVLKNLGFDGMALSESKGEVDRVRAAFKAADSAMQTTLSGGGDWGSEEAMSVLSQLLAKYGTAFGQQTVKSPTMGVDFVQAACDQAKRALPK
ncbi:MAG: helix-turn-helix transcriptional regulator [Deltaproteobacteria bacterium]|nr:helix-turn-helix transcriptional regulator [Deltaproteobacteria bacterium]